MCKVGTWNPHAIASIALCTAFLIDNYRYDSFSENSLSTWYRATIMLSDD